MGFHRNKVCTSNIHVDSHTSAHKGRPLTDYMHLLQCYVFVQVHVTGNS